MSDKPWLAQYPDAVSADILQTEDTLLSLFEDTCDKYSTREALSCQGEVITFKQLHKYATNLASYLYKIGLRKNDKVAIIMPNIMQYVISVFAIFKSGCIVVNVNPLYTSSEMEYIIVQSTAKVAIVFDMMADKLTNLVHSTQLQNVIVTKMPDPYNSFFKRVTINFAMKHIRKVIPDIPYKYHCFSDAIKYQVNSSVLDEIELVSDDIAFIQYTGATTGKPKGAVLLHRNLVANVNQVYEWVKQYEELLTADHIVISALPLYHIFSLTANLFVFFFLGAKNVLVPNPRDLKSLLSVLKNNKFTIFNALDTLYNHLLSSAEFNKLDFSAFKFSITGGMPIRKSVVTRWKDATGITLSNCYGLTELSPAVSMNLAHTDFNGSVGYPIPSTDVEIRDLETLEVKDINEKGVIWAKGPQLMKEYWNNPDQTSKALRDGWFNTGDIGYLDEKGRLFISSRQNDMVIISGFNVYPAEIESVLDSFSEIQQAAVIGYDDNIVGEKLIAFIVLNAGYTLTKDEVMNRLYKELTRYKVPKKIIFHDSLPKTAVGKIDKVALKEFYKSN